MSDDQTVASRKIADEFAAKIDSGELAPGAKLPSDRTLVETYGVAVDGRVADGRIEVHPPSEVYRGDDYVYWGFGAGGLSALATHAGFSRVTIDATPTIDGHPRILATLERPGA